MGHLSSFRLHPSSAAASARLLAFLLALSCGAVCGAAEPAYPSKPVRLLVGFSPGGGTDVAARIIAKKLSETWGQQVVVDIRAGAGGLLAFELVAKANPDGYTLLAASPSFAIQPSIAARLPYDPIRDFAPITVASAAPYILVLYPGVEAKSVKELIALAKANPGKLNYASVGMGSYPHLDMERFMKAAGIEMTHVPYKGGAGQAIPAMVAGEVQVAFFNMASLLPHVKSGRLKALAAVPAQRLPELPDVPTLAEQGYPGIGTNAWQGLFAPAATPKPVVDKLYAGVSAVLAREKTGLAEKMMVVEVSPSPAEFTAQVRRETQSWGDFVRDAKIKVE